MHARDRGGGRKESEREGERKEEMDLAECIIAALKALRTRVSREEASMRAALNTSASHYVINVRELHERYVSRMRTMQ